MRNLNIGQLIIISILSLLGIISCESKSTLPPKAPDTNFTETYAPNKTGEIKTIQFNGKTITYEVIDGMAIYQGDMILGKASELEKILGQESLIETQAVVCDGKTYYFLFSSCNTWSNGIVRYTFANDWPNNTEMRRRIRAAIAHWEQKTNLRFIESDSGERILFGNSDGCSSWVGRVNAATDADQDIEVGMKCSVGSIIHEIGHAIGIFHEQSRQDRNSFVQINTGNIKSGKAHNFDRHIDDAKDIGSYDSNSIMHYSCWAFSTGTRRTAATRTIVPLDGTNCNSIGQRNGLSEGDILSAYSLYLPKFSIKDISNGAEFTRNITTKYISLDFDIEAVANKYIIWTGDWKSGTLYSGKFINLNPSTIPLGNHTITAKIIINGTRVLSKSVDFSIVNIKPTVKITEPSSSNQSFCSASKINFRASASDVDDPNNNLKLTWRIGNGSNFATGTSASKSFSPGNYTVNVQVKDAQGATAKDSVRIKVSHCTSTAPNVNIISPADQGGDPDVYLDPSDVQGNKYTITLKGAATDKEDGKLSGAALVWTTDRADLQPGGPSTGNQVLGTGEIITVDLQFPVTCNAYIEHKITLTATDSNGTKSSTFRIIRFQYIC